MNMLSVMIGSSCMLSDLPSTMPWLFMYSATLLYS